MSSKRFLAKLKWREIYEKYIENFSCHVMPNNDNRLTSAAPIYAINDLTLRIDSHNLNTASSWFQPVVVRQVSGRSYAFTVAGPVYFTKESKKWPGAYLDSSSLPFYMPYICKEYRSPYIKGGKIGLGWIS